jgi:transcription elongation factor GreA
VAGGSVGLGSTVVVRDQEGAENTWRIVSSHDAAPAEGRLSAESPVAVALLGRSPGDKVSVSLPRGKRTLTVLTVG